MSFVDKVKNKVQEATGKTKESVGDATDNEELEREGRADQGEAGVKQAGEHMKDGVRDVKNAVENTTRKN